MHMHCRRSGGVESIAVLLRRHRAARFASIALDLILIVGGVAAGDAHTLCLQTPAPPNIEALVFQQKLAPEQGTLDLCYTYHLPSTLRVS
ncbi:hypothetical protein C7974DRAFT_190675 [Boeremia exigua]|uniref:uncharacterized protein n=1 Tax=Boeremia exigua TaxID=749465 RepID=UPI001E8E86EC|nr:uncharacterized protein C7974DRAFT_190675 [Boeremia exigua]KAH6629655.1 hypothetical protein C7974DRAFT_190675 [Boeremia exigua]